MESALWPGEGMESLIELGRGDSGGASGHGTDAFCSGLAEKGGGGGKGLFKSELSRELWGGLGDGTDGAKS